MMDILVVSQYYSPEPFRIHEICAELVACGHTVTVLTGLPNYPEGKIYPGFRWFRRRKEIIDGVLIRRCWQISRGRGKLRLALNYMSFALSGSLRMFFSRRKFDSIFVYEVSPITMAIPALVYRALRKTPVRLYCMDLWPESLKTVGISDKSRVYAAARRISYSIFRKCDTIIVASSSFLGHLNAKVGIQNEKLCYIPQHAEGFFLQVTEEAPEDSPIRFLFAGNIGHLQNIDCILTAISQMKSNKRFVLDLVGSGSYLEEARALTEQLSIQDRVVFHGRHPMEAMLGYYQNAHAFLLTLRDDSDIGGTLPGKLQSYMASARPILGAIGGSAADVINESMCGRCVTPGDSRALSEMMDDFLENREAWSKYGGNGRRYFTEHFTKDIFMEKLLDVL
jgi:glycosyltransferase involved in cell wall biosynthesis